MSLSHSIIFSNGLNISGNNPCSRMDNQERTFIMIKPDGVQRGLIGEIVARFEKKGFKLVAMKFVQVIKKQIQDILS